MGNGAMFIALIAIFRICESKLSPPSPEKVLRDTSDEGESYTTPHVNWRKVNLDEHNILRRKHGVINLQQDTKLDQVAQKYAEYLATKNLFEHSKDNEYGENLMITSADNEVDAVQDAVASWYEEIKDYDYNKPGYKEGTSHFTTMMWKTTTHVGVGVAWNPKEEQFVVVANYNPGGNVDGEYTENVLKAIL